MAIPPWGVAPSQWKNGTGGIYYLSNVGFNNSTPTALQSLKETSANSIASLGSNLLTSNNYTDFTKWKLSQATTVNGNQSPTTTLLVASALRFATGGGTGYIGGPVTAFTTFTYTGKSGNTLTGCSGLPASVSNGDVVQPNSWTLTSTTATHNTGNALAMATQAANFTPTVGSWYLVLVTVAGTLDDTNTINIGLGANSTGGQGNLLDNGSAYAVLQAATTAGLVITPSSNFAGQITTIYVYKITQATPIENVYDSSGFLISETRMNSFSTNGGVFFGVGGGANNVSGTSNISYGYQALQANYSGSYNAAIGSGALKLNATGQFNTAIGNGALANNISGNTNLAIGASSLSVNSNGGSNIGIGLSAGGGNTSGNQNTYIGVSSGTNNTTGNNNTVIGSYAQLGSNNLTNATAIGSQSQVAQSNSLVLGSINGINSATSNTNVGIGTNTPGEALEVAGNLYLDTAGNKIRIATGTNASIGTGTLSGGTATISTTAVTASSLVFLTDTGGGVLANIGSLYVGTITAGTSFVVNSTNALDSSNFNWHIIN